MFNSPIITTIISIVFIFFVFSMMASLVHEYIVKISKKRGKFLASALRQLLTDEFINQVDFGQIIYNHPLISGLKEKSDALPSYIPADIFASALIDSVIDFTREYDFTDQETPAAPTTPKLQEGQVVHPDQFANFIDAVARLKDSGLKKTFQSFLVNATNYGQLKSDIERWYNHYMDRVTGWYKKFTAGKMAWIAWVIAIFFNVDTINILHTLRNNNALNYAIAASAQDYVVAHKDSTFKHVSTDEVKGVMALSDNLRFPVGYNVKVTDHQVTGLQLVKESFGKLGKQADNDGGWLILLLGWFISAMAISKGAPFWFDVLSKFVNVRMAGTKPNKTQV